MPVLLLDWPFSGADVIKENAIIDLLRILRDNNHLILVSTHNNDGRSMTVIPNEERPMVFYDHTKNDPLTPTKSKGTSS